MSTLKHHVNDTITIGTKTFTPADAVFDIKMGIAGETLRECLPFFDQQVVGMDSDLLLETLSVHFDVTYVIENIRLEGPYINTIAQM